ncbi:MAG: 30S ribosomal protein S17 [Candidatus Saccharimonadales bacterium]|nr:30S ribosomal protein S17 [Candidatus Saccharimonadales bacterium]
MAQTITGRVVKDAMEKSLIVSVTTRKTHPIYSKQYNVTKRYTVHDEKNEAKLGDLVQFTEVPPISRHKSWNLTKVIEKAPEKKK